MSLFIHLVSPSVHELYKKYRHIYPSRLLHLNLESACSKFWPLALWSLSTTFEKTKPLFMEQIKVTSHPISIRENWQKSYKNITTGMTMSIQETDNDNILRGFPASARHLTDSETNALQRFSSWEYVVLDETDSVFSELLKNAVSQLLATQKVYFVLLENGPTQMSRVRSHRKLLYWHRAAIGPENFTEVEMSIPPNQSQMAALVRLTEQNFDYCLEHLITSHLAFGYVLPLGSRSFEGSETNFLSHVLSEMQNDGRINIPKVLARYIKPGRQLFRIFATGRDEEVLEFFMHQSDAEAFAEILKPVEVRLRAEFEN
jgi:hypothetical protein